MSRIAARIVSPEGQTCDSTELFCYAITFSYSFLSFHTGIHIPAISITLGEPNSFTCRILSGSDSPVCILTGYSSRNFTVKSAEKF